MAVRYLILIQPSDPRLEPWAAGVYRQKERADLAARRFNRWAQERLGLQPATVITLYEGRDVLGPRGQLLAAEGFDA